jgi:cysteine synthase A
MVGIAYSYKGRKGAIYAKCEYYNYTGSIKDRMALNILREAYLHGTIRPGDRIVEVTSGNTGIAISALGTALGHKVSIIMPDWMSKERKDIIRSLGAEIIEVSKEQGGFTGSLKIADEIAATEPNVFLPRQFSNNNNVLAHKISTGPEILHQLQKSGLRPHVFVAGVGTGGTVMGVSEAFRAVHRDVKIHPLEPAESPTLSTGYKTGTHRIQGISDEFIPDILKLDQLDEVVSVSDGDSILMAQKLASTFGMAVGISSGANLIGAITLQERYGFDVVVATVFADCNKKYLSTDLMKVEPVKEDYISPYVELLDFSTLPKAF